TISRATSSTNRTTYTRATYIAGSMRAGGTTATTTDRQFLIANSAAGMPQVSRQPRCLASPGLVTCDDQRFLFTLPASLGASFACGARSPGEGGSKQKPPTREKMKPATKLPTTSSGIIPFTRLTTGARNRGPLLRSDHNRIA